MVRKIIVALVVLAIAIVPVPTLARDGGHGGHEFHGGHDRFGHGFHRFGGVWPYPDDAYAPGCYWQEGYWGPNQPYIDQYGFERFEPVWVPGQSVCY